ncbi:MAG: hypothetical protein JKY70_11365 [Mucilaginibacter sp.]|nr:hypothetical protein [Mucilaginibacter sp.]
MEAYPDNQQPEDDIDDPANQEDFPATEPLDAEDEADIDIDNDDSEEIPDGDDVDLNRAE